MRVKPKINGVLTYGVFTYQLPAIPITVLAKVSQEAFAFGKEYSGSADQG